MPRASARECSYPGCSTLVRDTTRCLKHPVEAWGGGIWAKRSKLSAHSRGYDYQWQRARKAYLVRYPICELRLRCRGAPATEVDHIVPIAWGGDRLNFANLQAICVPCHRAKTLQEQRRRGDRA